MHKIKYLKNHKIKPVILKPSFFYGLCVFRDLMLRALGRKREKSVSHFSRTINGCQVPHVHLSHHKRESPLPTSYFSWNALMKLLNNKDNITNYWECFVHVRQRDLKKKFNTVLVKQLLLKGMYKSWP